MDDQPDKAREGSFMDVFLTPRPKIDAQPERDVIKPEPAPPPGLDPLSSPRAVPDPMMLADQPIPDPPDDADADGIVRKGEALADGATIGSVDDVIDALKQIYDPEIPVNIYDLGLIYAIDLDDKGDVSIRMTLTAPACPVAGELPGQVAEAACSPEGIGQAAVEVVWDPPWTPGAMSEDARMALDYF